MKKSIYFSLVELLTVVVIASILLSIAVPAFSRMMRGSASTQAARELMGKISYARSQAIAQQTPVAIVFYACEKPSGATLSRNYAYSAYRICTVKFDDANEKWVFQDWIGEWAFFPQGIAVGLPSTMTTTLPVTEFADHGASQKENEDALIREVENSTLTDFSNEGFFKVGAAGSGTSPVYHCDLSDIYPDNSNLVTFRNAIVFNSNGMLEKPKNRSLDDNANKLTPDTPIIIPLREALIDGNTVSFDCEPKEYIPVRIDPSGKTYFFDGYVEY